MNGKISFAELVGRVQSGSLTSEEIGRYFVAYHPASGPFAPKLAINEETVDITGVERTARAAAPELGFEASRASRMQGFRTAMATLAVASAAAEGSTIAEGDSWFNLPDFLGIFPQTIVDHLQPTNPTINLARWGDELRAMILTGEYLPLLASGKVKVMLFSGGGNDMLGGGELYRFLRLYNNSYQRPEDAPYYVNQSFHRGLDQIDGLFRQLADVVIRASPRTKLLVHGYDYAIPRVDGMWLGAPMLRQGLDPFFKADLCQAIVKLMIDLFNNRLLGLKRSYPNNVVYVNLRGMVRYDLAGNVDEWFDELHPKDVAARRIAREKFVPEIDRIVSGPAGSAASAAATTAPSPRSPRRRAGKPKR